MALHLYIQVHSYVLININDVPDSIHPDQLHYLWK